MTGPLCSVYFHGFATIGSVAVLFQPVLEKKITFSLGQMQKLSANVYKYFYL